MLWLLPSPTQPCWNHRAAKSQRVQINQATSVLAAELSLEEGQLYQPVARTAKIEEEAPRGQPSPARGLIWGMGLILEYLSNEKN